MANIKSKIKRIGTNEKARVRNLEIRTELKTRVKNVRKLVDSKDAAKAASAYQIAAQKLDISVSKGVIHKNQAANRKAKLAKKLQTLSKEELAKTPLKKITKTNKGAASKAAPKKASTSKAPAKKPAAKKAPAKK
jgi:small subunit ribosomal protein S20